LIEYKVSSLGNALRLLNEKKNHLAALDSASLHDGGEHLSTQDADDIGGHHPGKHYEKNGTDDYIVDMKKGNSNILVRSSDS
jgi:hypothetical protein